MVVHISRKYGVRVRLPLLAMNLFDMVTVLTETVFDEYGIPVSVNYGLKAKIIELDDEWAQVVFLGHGEVFGVPIDFLKLMGYAVTEEKYGYRPQSDNSKE